MNFTEHGGGFSLKKIKLPLDDILIINAMEAQYVKVKKSSQGTKLTFLLMFISVIKCSQLSVYHEVFPLFYQWNELIIESQQGC